eukprot:gene57705-biopygen40157
MTKLKEDQSFAGKEQERCTTLESALREDTQQIDTEKAQADATLGDAKPALEKAKAAVSSIPEKDLREIRQYAKPPATVERVMQMVVVMLTGQKKYDWRSVKEVMAKDGFLRELISFESTRISRAAKDEVASDRFLGDPRFDAALAYKASKAAGPLWEWCSAQLMYAKILLEIEPLTRRIAELTLQKEQKTKELKETQLKLAELNASVARMEEEPQALETTTPSK